MNEVNTVNYLEIYQFDLRYGAIHMAFPKFGEKMLPLREGCNVINFIYCDTQ